MTERRTIRCIAIDDEPIALSVISNFCNRIGGLELTVYSDPHAGLEAINAGAPDIVFLDIEMNDISGLSIAKHISPHTLFIFTTAYPQYALDGFELDAVDFLHKPFSFERFKNAIDKAFRRLNASTGGLEKKNIIVKQSYANISIAVNDILYVEAMENYAKIHKLDGTYTLAHNSLKNILSSLAPYGFIRTHRSFVVAIKHIARFNRQCLILSDDTLLPIGRSYVRNLSSKIDTEGNAPTVGFSS